MASLSLGSNINIDARSSTPTRRALAIRLPLPRFLSSIMTVDHDLPHFSDMDIETLHNQLLEAAASDDFAPQPCVDRCQSLSCIGLCGDPVIIPPDETHTTDLPITFILGESQDELSRFAMRTSASISMLLDNRARWDGDVDFAFVRPQAVEYRPAIPADYKTAIPSIFSRVDEDLQEDEFEDSDDDAVPCDPHGHLTASSTRQIAPLPRRTHPPAYPPRTPPRRIVNRNIYEDYTCAPQKRKAQAPRMRSAKKARKQVTFERPPTVKTTGRTRVSARAVGEFPCPVKSCDRMCRRIGDLTRHLQSRYHQPPSIPCPAGCSKVFTRKDAAKRHSKTDKCPLFRPA